MQKRMFNRALSGIRLANKLIMNLKPDPSITKIHPRLLFAEIQENDGKEIQTALKNIRLSEEGFQLRLLRRLRVELSDKISNLPLSKESQTYFLHQIAHVHNTEDLADLVQEISLNNHLSHSTMQQR